MANSHHQIRELSKVHGHELVDVHRDRMSRGFMYVISTPGHEISVVGQGAAILTHSVHFLMPWVKINRASLHWALHHSHGYKGFNLTCSEIDTGDATQCLKRLIQGPSRIFVAARQPGCYIGTLLARPKTSRLRRSETESEVNLISATPIKSKPKPHSSNVSHPIQHRSRPSSTVSSAGRSDVTVRLVP